MSEIPCGSIHRVPIGAIADKAARTIMGYRSDRAVTLDPEGRVFVDTPANAADCDLVGVYRYDGLLELPRMIQADLRHEVEVRKLRPLPSRYKVGEAGLAQRARAGR